MEESYVMFIENDFIAGTDTYKTIEYMKPNDYETNYCYEPVRYNYDVGNLTYHHHYHHQPMHMAMPLTVTEQIIPIFTTMPYGWHSQTSNYPNNVMQSYHYVVETDIMPQQLIYEQKCNYRDDVNLERITIMGTVPQTSSPMPPPPTAVPVTPQMTEFVYHTLQPCANILPGMVVLMEDEHADTYEVEMAEIMNEEVECPEFYECEMDQQEHCYENGEPNENMDDYEIERDNEIASDIENDNGMVNGRASYSNRKCRKRKNIYRAKEGYIVEEPLDDEVLNGK